MEYHSATEDEIQVKLIFGLYASLLFFCVVLWFIKYTVKPSELTISIVPFNGNS